MESNRSNMSIGCTVEHCKFQNAKERTCSLSSIQVGCCGPAKSNPDCTECCSFQLSSP